MDVIVVTDTTTRAEILEAITHLNNSAKRLPTHFVERRAKIHERIDALLDELEFLA